MRFMVIETFLPGCREQVYARFGEKGRMLPDGLRFVERWLEKDGDRCVQLMETDRPELFAVWTENWKDIISFEIIPVES